MEVVGDEHTGEAGLREREGIPVDAPQRVERDVACVGKRTHELREALESHTVPPDVRHSPALHAVKVGHLAHGRERAQGVVVEAERPRDQPVHGEPVRRPVEDRTAVLDGVFPPAIDEPEDTRGEGSESSASCEQPEEARAREQAPRAGCAGFPRRRAWLIAHLARDSDSERVPGPV